MAATADEVWQVRNGWPAGEAEPAAEIVPEGDAELGAGFGQAEEGIAAVAAGIAAGAATDLALGDIGADVVLRSVGVQRGFGMVEHDQQFVLVGVQPLEQAIERDEPGSAAEDAIEAGAQLAAAAWCGVGAVSFQLGVESPDERPDLLLCGTLGLGEGVELVHQPLGVDPAQRVRADCELAGVVTDDDGLA